MRQKTFTRLAVYTLLICCLLAIYFHRREGFTQLASATYLGWDGGRWILCDDADRTRGIESLPGGVVIVENVTALQVIGDKYVLAKDGSGKMFLIEVNEWGHDQVQSFSSENAWTDALKAAGISAPDVQDPAHFYK